MNAYQCGQHVLCDDYSQYTPTGKGYFEKHDRYFETPEKYDIVYFYTATLGRVSHVGFVKDVSWNSDGSFDLTTYEGNTSSNMTEFNRNGGILALKKYYNVSKVGHKNRIDGFGRPLYSKETCLGEDVEKVLEEWVGYEEKKSWDPLKSIFTKHENPGTNNVTMFGYWYAGNKPVEAQWCQQTISWAVYKACENRYKNATALCEWRKSETGDWYYYVDGAPIKGKWSYIDGRWYVFDNSGRMIKGWFKQSEGDWYYLAEDGGMLSSQWLEDDGKWYYLTASGVMARNAYIKDTSPLGPGGEYKYFWVNSAGEYEDIWDTKHPELDIYDLVC